MFGKQNPEIKQIHLEKVMESEKTRIIKLNRWIQKENGKEEVKKNKNDIGEKNRVVL